MKNGLLARSLKSVNNTFSFALYHFGSPVYLLDHTLIVDAGSLVVA
jgi:hypothetical protein